MSKKITNSSIVSAINLHFYKKGQKLSNLQKATREKLDLIIKKYDLNLDDLLVNLNEANEIDKINKQEREREQEEREREQERERIKKQEINMMKWNTLSLEDKEIVKNSHYDRYVRESLSDNENNIRESKEYEKSFKKMGDIIVRENETTICINGIILSMGYLIEIIPKEDYIFDENWIVLCRYNREIINNLYEVEMVKDGFEKFEDGEFYKTITKKPKIKSKKEKKNKLE